LTLLCIVVLSSDFISLAYLNRGIESFQYNTEAALGPFFLCKTNCDFESSICPFIDPLQFLAFCFHSNYILILRLEFSEDLKILAVEVGNSLAIAKEKVASMAGLFILSQ
jgi:hypothetical protein